MKDLVIWIKTLLSIRLKIVIISVFSVITKSDFQKGIRSQQTLGIKTNFLILSMVRFQEFAK